MKKILGLVLVVALALVGCKQGNKVDPNAPLELTVENLAGKWVKESNTTAYYEFKIDYTYSANSESGSFSFTGNDEIEMKYKDPFGNDANSTYKIVLYRDYLMLNTTKWLKE